MLKKILSVMLGAMVWRRTGGVLMMKIGFVSKLFGIMLGVMLLLSAGVASAMTFGEPVEIGKINYDMGGMCGGGWIIEKDISNSGITLYGKRNRKSYKNGIVKFGMENSIYVHYIRPGRDFKYGESNLNNTVTIRGGGENQIYQIESNTGFCLYCVFSIGIEGEGADATEFVMLGRQNEDKWVKYVDSKDISQKYFGRKREYKDSIGYNEPIVKGDTIIVTYFVYRNYEKNIGEFRFKWDDAAQWFGVEQVVY